MNNTIHLIGRLTHDIKVTEYPADKRTRVEFSVAVKNYSDKDKPYYFNVQLWNGVAENAIKLKLRKGSEVHVFGRLQYFSYDKNVEGTKVPTRDFYVACTGFHVSGKQPQETPAESSAA